MNRKIRFLLGLLVCLSFSTIMKSEDNGPVLLYMEFNQSKTVLGKLEKSTGYIDQYAFLRKVPIQTITSGSDTYQLDSLFTSMLQQAVDCGKKVLFYAHSWLGEVEPYFSPSVKTLANSVVPDSNWVIIILLRPTSISGYYRNHEEAYKSGLASGRFLKPVMEILYPHRSSCYLIAHSMGNRFLEGMVQNWHDDQFYFNHIILAAPDIDILVVEDFSKKIFHLISRYTYTPTTESCPFPPFFWVNPDLATKRLLCLRKYATIYIL
jgi:hypothetical protein